jgi:hypothetical protein
VNGKNVEHFRAMLQNILDSTEDNADPYKRGIFAVAKAIKGDFDRMFPPEIWQTDSEAIRIIAENTCPKDTALCPICESQLTVRKGKRGNFLGCPKFPLCRGSRSIDGRITVNEALKTFIADKIYEEQCALDSHMGRFQGIDLDDEG